ncbi:hypothetical protein BH20CHL6_BH20CHL6_00910 [soil metagenome]
MPRRSPQIGSSGPPPRRDIPSIAVVAVFLVLLAGTGFFVANALGPAPEPSRTPPGVAAGSGSPSPNGSEGPGEGQTGGPTDAAGSTGSGAPTGSGQPTTPTPGEPGASPSPSPSASPGDASASPSASPSPSAGPQEIPIVPVVGFWSTARGITTDELRAALDGGSDDYPVVVVPAADRAAIGEALGITVSSAVRDGDADDVRAAFQESGLGLVRAGDVVPAMRALSIDGQNLFGSDHVAAAADWPLTITDEVAAGEGWDDAPTWTIVAGGDIMLDRGVARQVTILEKGVDFPFDGGSAEITGYTCCSGFGYEVPDYRRTGDDGAVRQLVTSADLAMANLETGINRDFTYHSEGVTFTSDPRLLDGVQNAGIDWLSLANNHIRDGGPNSVLHAREELDARGISYGGAGADLAEAEELSILEVEGRQVAVVACDAIAGYYYADEATVGSAPCGLRRTIPRIEAAREVADVVIVFPHWGVEYTANPTANQRRVAAEWMAAGADLVLGNHAHWTAAMEEIDENLVFYALGNFVFDQMWQEQTMQGMLVELTFRGSELTQAWLHPTLVIDSAQPNFMDPATDGQIVLNRVREASRDLLSY